MATRATQDTTVERVSISNLFLPFSPGVFTSLTCVSK